MNHSHFGVYAIIVNEGHILLAEKTRGPYTGMYDLPGGGMEENELLEDTLCREVMEETGCRISGSEQIGGFSVLFHYQEKKNKMPNTLRHVGILYKTNIVNNPAFGIESCDSKKCAWIKKEEINEKNSTPFVLISKNYIF